MDSHRSREVCFEKGYGWFNGGFAHLVVRSSSGYLMRLRRSGPAEHLGNVVWKRAQERRRVRLFADPGICVRGELPNDNPWTAAIC